MRKYLYLVMLLGVPVLAELKPVSTVETDLCGWLNRSERLCTAMAGATRNEYIFLNHFLGANKAIGPVKKTQKGAVTTFSGVAVDGDTNGNYQVEKTYKLTVSEKEGQFTGTLTSEYRDLQNKRVVQTYRTIPLERMAHTRAVRAVEKEEALPALITTTVVEDKE